MKLGKFNCSKARITTDEDGNVELCLAVAKDFRYVARRIAKLIAEKPDKLFTVTVQDEVKDRTLRQNNMMWALCNEIALHDNGGRTGGITPGDVYYEALSRYGIAEVMSMRPEAFDNLKKNYFPDANLLDTYVDENGAVMCLVKCVLGSSGYDTKTMSNLIDGLLDEAAKREIDTEETRFIARQQEGERNNGKKKN